MVYISVTLPDHKKLLPRFYALLIRRSPWTTWTNDIYDAMRCIDHLPIS